MKRILLAALIAVLSSGNFAHSDEYFHYIKMTCDPMTAIVLLESGIQWNKPPSEEEDLAKEIIFTTEEGQKEIVIFKEGICKFTNGREIKLKLGADEAHPYGECGGSPAEWLSLWVDRRKILSRYVCIPRCMAESLVKSVTVQGDEIEILEYGHNGDIPFRKVNPEVINKKIIAIDPNCEVDEIEYPVDGERVLPGSKIIEWGGENSICGTYVSKNWDSVAVAPGIEKRPLNRANNLYRTIVDIDNDGQEDEVYIEERWGKFEFMRLFVLGKEKDVIRGHFDALPLIHVFSREWEYQCEAMMSELRDNAILFIGSDSRFELRNRQGDLPTESVTMDVQTPFEIKLKTFERQTYIEISSGDVVGLFQLVGRKFKQLCVCRITREHY